MFKTSMFSYHKPTNCFLAEASDLQIGIPPLMFTLESHKTGRQITMERIETVTDREGEVQSWKYKAALKDLNINLEIFND
jgi:hypothetical protein